MRGHILLLPHLLSLCLSLWHHHCLKENAPSNLCLGYGSSPPLFRHAWLTIASSGCAKMSMSSMPFHRLLFCILPEISPGHNLLVSWLFVCCWVPDLCSALIFPRLQTQPQQLSSIPSGMSNGVGGRLSDTEPLGFSWSGPSDL